VKPLKEQALRCAIYTRKSSEEGLEQDFNSLHAQREACEAYIRSQQGEGWRLRKTAYNDGGLSGATMERPALKQLLVDIEEGLVDVVVVYKVDRLTRSLSDFARMVEIFDGRQVSFVAVTQQFNTTTSMGRLTLNVLLSFAQFEREVTGERIRDKIAASKRKGMWMGGLVPLGYEVRDRQLAMVESEAGTVRHIFQRYCELGSVSLLKEDLDRDCLRSKLRIASNGLRSGEKSFSRGALYTLLRNPIYIGEIRHKGARYPGQHQPIVDRSVWDKTQELLRLHTVRTDGKPSGATSSPLIGKLFDDQGERLTPSHAVKGNRRYRYYVSSSLMKGAARKSGQGWRVPAFEIERNLAAAVAGILDERTAIVADIEQAGLGAHDITSILATTAVWSTRLRSEAEASTALNLLVDRAELHPDGIRLSIRLPIPTFDKPKAGTTTLLSLTRHIPLRVRRCGIEMRLVIGGGSGAAPRIDSTILKATARARRWFDDLVSGRAASMVEIGKREGVGKRYVSRMIRLAFLAPAIVERIAEGRQPPDLTAQFLSTGPGDLPLSWSAQEQLLGFADPA
jgi:DNA invertase Pin-like site-specific DNA recombinase